jgi:acetyl esterase/lipase
MSKSPITITYSQVDGLNIQLDAYVPEASGSLPAVLYFHGGGLVCGSRDDFLLPEWLKGLSSARAIGSEHY